MNIDDYEKIKSLGQLNSTTFPKLLTIEDVSFNTGVSVERLTELCEASIAPHILVDGNLRFSRRIIFSWIKQNLVSIVKGQAIPNHLIINKILDDKIPQELLPVALSPMAEKILRFSTFYIPPSVYFLVDNKTVVYIGSSINPPARIQTHINDGKLFDNVLYLPVPKSELVSVEEALIREIPTKYNRQPMSGKPDHKSLSIVQQYIPSYARQANSLLPKTIGEK